MVDPLPPPRFFRFLLLRCPALPGLLRLRRCQDVVFAGLFFVSLFSLFSLFSGLAAAMFMFSVPHVYVT